MPIYESTMSIEKMQKAKRYQDCAICGSRLVIFYDLTKHEVYLACHDHPEHEGIAKPYENREYNIESRREHMEKEIGVDKARQLERFSGVTSLRKEDAQEIIDIIWPEAGKASPAEVFKAVTICVQYGLNPLMKHLYLIPFWNKDRKGYDYVAVLGIGATRLIASRKHAYSYIDDTPRLMTAEDQEKTFGEVSSNKLQAVTILKDMKTGATARGYGFWPKDVDPKGVDKGNSKANMAFIRSERQALDRLYPADLPKNVEVVDEQYEVTATVELATQPLASDTPAEAVKVEEATPAAAKTPAESQTVEKVEASSTPIAKAGNTGTEGNGTPEIVRGEHAEKPNLKARVPDFKTGTELFAWGSKQGLALEEMRRAIGCDNPLIIKDLAAATKAVVRLIPAGK